MAQNFVEVVLQVKDLATKGIEAFTASVNKVNEAFKGISASSAAMAEGQNRLLASVTSLQPILDKETASLERLVSILAKAAPALQFLANTKTGLDDEAKRVEPLAKTLDSVTKNLRSTATATNANVKATDKFSASIAVLNSGLSAEATNLEKLGAVLNNISPALLAASTSKTRATKSAKLLGDEVTVAGATFTKSKKTVDVLTQGVQVTGGAFNAAAVNVTKFNSALAATPAAKTQAITSATFQQPAIPTVTPAAAPVVPNASQQSAQVRALTAQVAALQKALAKLNGTNVKLKNSSEDLKTKLLGVGRSIASIQGPLGPVAGRFSSLIGTFSTLGGAFGLVAVGVSSLTAVLLKGINTAAIYERQVLKIGAVIHATGGIAGLSTEQVLGFAEALERNTLATGEQARDASAILLTFKQIRGENFNEILNFAQSLSSVLGESLSGSAKKLGRAFEDPVQGLESLREAGVFFTTEEKKLLAVFKETNAVAAAHDLLLKKLGGTFNDIATKEAKGAAGAIQQVGEAFNRLFIAIGNTDTVNALVSTFSQLASAIDAVTGFLGGSISSLNTDQLESELVAIDAEIARLEESLDSPISTAIFDSAKKAAIDTLASINPVLSSIVAINRASKPSSAPGTEGDLINAQIRRAQLRAAQVQKEQEQDEVAKKAEVARAQEQAQQLENLQAELNKEIADQSAQTRKQTVEAERAFADKQLEVQQGLYDQGLISAEDFFAARLALQRASINKELTDLQKQRDAVSLELASVEKDIAKGAGPGTLDDTKESIRLREELKRLDAQSFQLRSDSGKLEIKDQNELLKIAQERRLVLLSLQKQQADRTGSPLSQPEVTERLRLETAPERAKLVGDEAALTIFDAEIEKRAAEETFNELDKIVNQRRAELNVTLQNINNLERAGFITSATASSERIDAEVEFTNAIQGTIDAQDKLAVASGNQALTNSIITSRKEMEGLRNQTSEFVLELGNTFSGEVSNLFEDIRTNTEDVGEAFENFAETLKNSIARIIQQNLAEELTASLTPKASGLFSAIGGFFGGSGTAEIKFDGGEVTAAEGGYISGPGTGTSDSIRARLSNGEYVVPAKATAQWLPALEAMRQGKFTNYLGAKRVVLGPTRIPSVNRFAAGGLVAAGNTNTNSSSVSVKMTVNAQDASSFSRSESQIVSSLARQIKYFDRRNN